MLVVTLPPWPNAASGLPFAKYLATTKSKPCVARRRRRTRQDDLASACRAMARSSASSLNPLLASPDTPKLGHQTTRTIQACQVESVVGFDQYHRLAVRLEDHIVHDTCIALKSPTRATGAKGRVETAVRSEPDAGRSGRTVRYSADHRNSSVRVEDQFPDHSQGVGRRIRTDDAKRTVCRAVGVKTHDDRSPRWCHAERRGQHDDLAVRLDRHVRRIFEAAVA